jgi:hypothetical protein
MKNITHWVKNVQDDPSVDYPIVPIELGNNVVRALTAEMKHHEERFFKKGSRHIGNIANFLRDCSCTYKVLGFRNGGAILEGFVDTVSLKYLRKV